MLDKDIIYSVVVPCYNSALCLDELVARIDKVFIDQGLNYEIILVNDATPDNNSTWLVIKNLASNYTNVIGIDLQFNVGQFRALMVGFEQSQGEYIITLDDDLQHPPEEIPKLIKKMRQTSNVDVVIGKYHQKSHSIFRNAGRMLVNFIFKNIYKNNNNISSTSFRILKRNLVETLLLFKTIRPIMGALILQSTNRIENVEVEHQPRRTGRSGYSLTRLINSTLDNVIDSTVVPLRIFSVFGGIVSFVSFVMTIYYLLSWFIGDINVPGFVTQVLLITFFGGWMLMGIGILGEYVSRIVVETAKSPRSVIREICGNNKLGGNE